MGSGNDRDSVIPGNQIQDDSICQSELKITNTPTDGQIIKINMPDGDFTAIDLPSGGGTPFIGTFTRDMSLATGTQAVTGVGFQPKLVIFFATQNSSAKTSWGFDNATNAKAILDSHNIASDTYTSNGASSISVVQGVGLSYAGSINSNDSDGFTIGWTRTGAITGSLTIEYVAFP